MDRLDLHLQQRLRQQEKQGLLRSLMVVKPFDHDRIQVEGKQFVNLAGNDYLGLAADRSLVQEFYEGLGPGNCLEHYGPGSGASRLMTGNHDGYRQLEQGLAELYDVERVLLFNSGYHINIGLLPALAEKGDLVLADKFCHASLIDGMRLSRAKVIRYPHLDYERIEALLQKHRDQYRNIFLVTESIFSMDGDCANLSFLVELKEKYGAVLYLDEAHAVGVRGMKVWGLPKNRGSAIGLTCWWGHLARHGQARAHLLPALQQCMLRWSTRPVPLSLPLPCRRSTSIGCSSSCPGSR